MDDPTSVPTSETPESSTIPPAYTDKPLTYEETPVIDPWASQPQSSQTYSPSPSTEHKRGSGAGLLGNLILFILLFAVGIGLSIYFRQYLPNVPEGVPQIKLPQLSKRGTTPPIEPVESLAPAQFTSQWTTYQAINGVTRQPIPGVSFRLPLDVLEPICDGSSCGSEGTYLPGGTRFTVAPRGKGQILADYRGSIISDLQGQEFTTINTTVAGRTAVEFTGTFTGSTVAGYAFSQMRGVMVEVSPDLSLELNHFTPKGVDADFASDDAVFDAIVKTLELPALTVTPAVSLEKGGVVSTISANPSPTEKDLQKCLTYVNPCDSRSCDYDASKCGTAPR